MTVTTRARKAPAKPAPTPDKPTAKRTPSAKTPVKAAAATTSSTRGEKHTHCPLCGYEFSRPKARCATPAACSKRQEAAKA
jgi:hypothetical protein